MNHVKAIVAVCGVSAVASFASASVTLPAGWDLTMSFGDARGTSGGEWSAVQDPTAWTATSRPGPNGSPIYRIIGEAYYGGVELEFDVEFDQDPFVSSAFTVINNTGLLSSFTVMVTVPIFPPLFAPTTMTGSTSGTVGDGDGLVDQFGNGATVMTQANGRPYYEALVDGFGVRQLYPAFQQHAAPLNLTSDINTQNFINEVGPAVLNTIGLRNAFMLTPGDNASFTSTFIIVPAPAGIAAAGLLGLVGLRRRR